MAADAPASVTNTATVSGGGEISTSPAASDSTTINPPPDLTIASAHAGNFTQGDAADLYTIAVTNSGTGPTVGTATVVGYVPRRPDGHGQAARAGRVDLATVTATRSDAMAAGASYPAL